MTVAIPKIKINRDGMANEIAEDLTAPTAAVLECSHPLTQAQGRQLLEELIKAAENLPLKEDASVTVPWRGQEITMFKRIPAMGKSDPTWYLDTDGKEKFKAVTASIDVPTIANANELETPEGNFLNLRNAQNLLVFDGSASPNQLLTNQFNKACNEFKKRATDACIELHRVSPDELAQRKPMANPISQPERSKDGFALSRGAIWPVSFNYKGAKVDMALYVPYHKSNHGEKSPNPENAQWMINRNSLDSLKTEFQSTALHEENAPLSLKDLAEELGIQKLTKLQLKHSSAGRDSARRVNLRDLTDLYKQLQSIAKAMGGEDQSTIAIKVPGLNLDFAMAKNDSNEWCPTMEAVPAIRERLGLRPVSRFTQSENQGVGSDLAEGAKSVSRVASPFDILDGNRQSKVAKVSRGKGNEGRA